MKESELSDIGILHSRAPFLRCFTPTKAKACTPSACQLVPISKASLFLTFRTFLPNPNPDRLLRCRAYQQTISIVELLG